ncbi:hypothetical protein ABBQ38_012141 [Trebouxia sp. C0009 RCD-2024]
MPYKVPSHPLPGELALLDNITILHFRKSAISAAADSITKVLPETSSTMAGSQSPLQGMLSKDSVELVGSPQDFLLGSKSSLLGAGVQTPTAVQIMSSSSDASNRVTIPAQHLSRAAAPALLSFNKYSKLEAKQPSSFFGVMPTDTAFDAARLEFKLIDQPITSTASSDLTKPFNEAAWTRIANAATSSLEQSGAWMRHAATCLWGVNALIEAATAALAGSSSDANSSACSDADGNELFHLRRGFAMPVHLCFPCGQLGVSPLKIVVSAPSGAVLGRVQTSGRAYSSSGWLDVLDADHNLVYTIQEKLWVWPLKHVIPVLAQHVQDREEVAHTDTRWSPP